MVQKIRNPTIYEKKNCPICAIFTPRGKDLREKRKELTHHIFCKGDRDLGFIALWSL